VTEKVRTIAVDRAREGVYIPLDAFAGHEGIEIQITENGAVTIRASQPSLRDVCRAIDAQREALKREHGLFSDSTLLIREDRDRR
jgi:hypothetical protein